MSELFSLMGNTLDAVSHFKQASVISQASATFVRSAHNSQDFRDFDKQARSPRHVGLMLHALPNRYFRSRNETFILNRKYIIIYCNVPLAQVLRSAAPPLGRNLTKMAGIRCHLASLFLRACIPSSSDCR